MVLRFARLAFLQGATIALALSGVPLAAQDDNILDRIPTASAPGTVAAADIPDQGLWLDVAQAGLYQITLDGPGLIGLTQFDTPTGRSDGSDDQDRLLMDGSATQVGQLDDLLLVPGQAYLIQVAGSDPRGLSLRLVQALETSAALTGAAIPGLAPDMPMSVAPGQSHLLRIEGSVDLTLTGPAPGPLRFEVITTPGADLRRDFSGMEPGPGGIYPILPFDQRALYLEGSAEPDGSFPLVILRSTLLENPGRYDDLEPDSTDLGTLPLTGRSIRGALLANADQDGFDFVLDQDAAFDLGVQSDGTDPVFVSLSHDGTQVLQANFDTGSLFRPALALAAGSYRVDISGQQAAPRDYTISLAPTAADLEGEPDDQPDLAQQLAPGTTLRGTLGPENPGHAVFDVPVPGHLWELRAVQGLRDISLWDGNGTTIGQWDAQSGALVVRLALPPGRFTAQLRGDGPYALRLTDRGPAPQGTETEPNDQDTSANRLSPGDRVTGDFQTSGDTDFYELFLPAPTPLKITVEGPDDGPSVVDLFVSDSETLHAELAPGRGPVSYTATFPAGRQVIQWRSREQGVSGRYALRIERSDAPEPFEPNATAAMPADGNFSGQIGGFDALDKIFLPLPQGTGATVLTCQGDLRLWEVWTYGFETRLLVGEPGDALVLPFDPALGGAVELRVEHDPAINRGTYACRQRFAPDAAALADIAHDEAADETGATALPAGARISGSFETDRDHEALTITLPLGQLAGLRCDLDPSRLYADRPLGDVLDLPPLPGGIMPFVAGADPIAMEISPPSEGPFPQPWACDLIPETAFQPPSAIGPTAAFTGYVEPGAAPVPYDPAAALALLSGGRPDWLTPTQVTQDLALDIALQGIEQPYRAYSRLGQSGDLALRLTNPGAETLTLTYDITALADGWRLMPDKGTATLEPGASLDVAVALEMPPMQSPVNAPQIVVTARSGAQTRAATFAIGLDGLADERGAHRFWTALLGLRGGVNPLLWQHGARLIALDYEVVDADQAQDWAFLHDGEALHSGIPAWFRARQATFELAEAAPIAGIILHLRTTENRADWPAQLALELSMDGQTWQSAAQLTPSASDLPQIFALATVQTARFARLTRFGCRALPSCDAIALSDIGLVAPPEWRLSEPVNLADPLNGGHVVWAQSLGGTDPSENIFGGGWNINLIEAGNAEQIWSASETRGTSVSAAIAFHNGRAARITAIDWVGHPNDITRLTGAQVDYSLAGPAGPWRPLGTLPAPPAGLLAATLTLPAPVWARAVRLTLQRDAEENRALPDQIRIWEDPTAPPLLGLWEDDRADAGYEATEAPDPIFAPAPQGGATADTAVVLDLGRSVASSVQLERNEDWWQFDLPQGPPREVSLLFADAAQPEFTAQLTGPDGTEIRLNREVTAAGDLILSGPVKPGRHLLRVQEPPRSVAILWDTSGSVAAFVPGILASVRLWSQSLQPGRDRLQLLPFGQDALLLDDWAGTPEQIYPVLGALPGTDSSDSETAMGIAAAALAGQDGQRGIVILTDAETSQAERVWGALLQAKPRVIALSIDSGDAQGLNIMKDWAGINGGHFARVIGNAGLADGLDMAAALFRAPKGYVLTISADELREPEGAGKLRLQALPAAPDAPPTGGIEVILDASGSMLKRMPDGQRRIEVAHDALAGLVRDTLPAGTPFAFRAFGLAVDSCSSDLIVPLGPLDPASAETAIRDVPAINLAKTAIAASLALAAQDLADLAPPRAVVLVTDGEETCDGDVGAEITRLRAAGLDLRLTIVGFAIDDQALAANFAAWAREGGGQYLEAGDADGLDASITEAISPRFAIDRLYVDGRVEEVGLAGLDQDIDLPAGRYRLRPLQTAKGAVVEFDLTDQAAAVLNYDPALGLLQE